MYEQRLTERLIRYWTTLRKEEALPNFAQFNQGAIGELWLNCLVFSAQPSVTDKKLFRVLSVGQNVSQLFGEDMVGKDASKPALRAFGGGKIAGEIEQSALACAVVECEGQFVNPRNKVVKYRACLLPFASTTQSVSHIVAGISWREF